LKNCRSNPSEAIAKICQIKGTSFPDMLTLYKKTYMKFEKMLSKEDCEQVHQFREMNHVAKIIGFSEAYHSAIFSTVNIVSADSRNGYTFSYKSGTPLQDSYNDVTFHIRWNGESYFPGKEMLAILSDDIIFRK